ncbi:hypothetical protein ACFHW2_33225 [Actinomadura sp. LOL_016]|uniref:hypothetical protein n=1 Tax=unclassified Actinomadura TaxID=2626254 RepID=UPI003A80333D
MSGHTTRQSQRLLRTLFGDYWMAEGALAPAGAVAEMLGDYGVSVPAARAALRRSAQKGLLASSRAGRSTHYGLTDAGRRTLTEVWDRLVEFGTVAREWDGRWTCVAFSIPEQQRDQRHRLRSRWRWLGFAPLYDDVWVCPKVVDRQLRAVLAELRVGAARSSSVRRPAAAPTSAAPSTRGTWPRCAPSASGSSPRPPRPSAGCRPGSSPRPRHCGCARS